MPLPDYRIFSQKLDKLKCLAKQLPTTVPVATKDGFIVQVFTNIPIAKDPTEHWETFNQRMDALFGNELRDSKGRLLHVKRGAFEVDLVLKYFDEAASMGTLNWDLATIKLDRLLNEFKVLSDSAEGVTDPAPLQFEGARAEMLNPLGWWKTHEASFPTIARMARDYLAIPATSVSVERTFSKARHICADLRMSLKAETVAQALLSKVWIRSGLFDVNEPIKRKRKHGEIS